MSQLLSQKRYKMTEIDSESSEGESGAEDDDDDDESHSLVRAGNIKRLVLRNFMCHDHFELKFGPQMNFIIGRNGSGKSAVLTGISVGLGAKANDTSRGSSMKSLIKDGKSIARVLVEIGNEGIDAYEPNVYGKTIVVERKLTREGPNSYSIKSENGTTVSTKKKVLDEILQKFFIMVNNPLSFLSQDKAREFIASSTDQSRFAYFSEGTNIQSIILNYQEASKHILTLQKRLIAAKEYYEEATRKYLESEREYKKYKHSYTLRQQLDKIHCKIYWFNVEVLERRLKRRDEDIQEKNAELSLIDASMSAHQASVLDRERELEALGAEKSAVENQLYQEEEKLKQAESEYTKALAEVQSVRGDLTNYKTEIEDYATQVQNHKKDLAFEQKKIDEANGGLKELMQQRLLLLRTRQEKLTEERDEAQNELHGLESTSADMRSLNREWEELNSTKTMLQEKAKAIERSKNDRYAAFGLNINYLMRDVERETGWHHKPIGPIGCFVSVKEEHSKWSDLINASLQKTLDSFVVSDEHDRRLLHQHMRNKKIFKNIIVRSFEKFSFHQNNLGGQKSVLDLLDIQNDDVKYTLIDSTGIEDIVVCDSALEAEEVTKIRSVKQAFYLKDRMSGVRLTRRDGHLSSDPIYYSRDLRKLAGKISGDSIAQDLEDVRHQEADIQRRRNSLKAHEHRKKKDLQSSVLEKKAQIKEINNQIFNAEHALNEEGDHGKLESLQSQIEYCENQIKTREGMSVELLQKLKDLKFLLSQAKEHFDAERSEREKLVAKVAEHESNINNHIEGIQVSNAESSGLEKRKETILKDLEKLNEKLEKDSETHSESKRQAEEKCERSEVNILDSDSTESIMEEFRLIQEAIEEAERSNSKSLEEIQNELLDSKKLKDKCEQSLLDVDNARVTLENDLNARFENLNITIKEKLTRAKLSFEHNLSLRGFKGKLEFDFANKKVMTEVQTKDDKGARAVSSLSGGEKSFTQIAFLLSIWKVMKPRVCGLDEFDVFMDSVNRAIAIRLLIQELRGSVAQSIFITPQDIAVVGDLEDSEDVQIHRIKPPRND